MKPGVDFTGITTTFFCHDGTGRMLLQKRGRGCRDFPETWEEGGGGLEFGETLEEGVLREVFEEYGCQGLIEEQFPAYSILHTEQEPKRHWVGVPFVVRVRPEEIRRDADEFVTETGWFKPDELPKPRHPGFQLALDKYADQLKKYFY
jgi:8-oxo-dGTP diphosphatase